MAVSFPHSGRKWRATRITAGAEIFTRIKLYFDYACPPITVTVATPTEGDSKFISSSELFTAFAVVFRLHHLTGGPVDVETLFSRHELVRSYTFTVDFSNVNIRQTFAICILREQVHRYIFTYTTLRRISARFRNKRSLDYQVRFVFLIVTAFSAFSVPSMDVIIYTTRLVILKSVERVFGNARREKVNTGKRFE